MNSRNFEFLRPEHKELADLGGFAERYVHSDPASALIKLRLFGEQLVLAFYAHYGMQTPQRAKFIDLTENDSFKDSVPPVIRTKLTALRNLGNRAAHGVNQFKSDDAPYVLEQAFDLARWFAITVQAKGDLEHQQFHLPKPEEQETKGKIKREKKEALQRLAAQEAQMQAVLRDLEAARKEAAAAEKTKAELQEILQRTNQAANVLHFNEAQTRAVLIDKLLAQAGWDVAPGEQSTDQVQKELKLEHQPTESGVGYADYVLFDDDGTPLAVIEAKKTVLHSEKGRAQAKSYADSLAKMYESRPVIFYTNGFDIYIWDDAKGETPRNLYGFYSAESLRRLKWETAKRKATRLADDISDEEIAGRTYQIEAIKRVCETFDTNRRHALIVMATGTGKTRVAIALTKLLIDAGRAKRVLFLCDRRELRKQAHNAYKQYLESEPRTYLNAKTYQDRNKTVYLATYPAMMKYFQSFDVGFFDLIIADESHRSIYNRYADIFKYFDALQVGLTATPVDKIQRNTFRLFKCEDGDPTAQYSYKDAINDNPPSLVPFHAVKHDTQFLRGGIRYENMTPEQKAQADEQVEDSESIDYSKEQVSKAVFNKDTDRRILRNLMENGIRNADGTHVGKTIIFARNHNHAIQLQNLFDEMYPQYMKPKQEFCAVVDNYVDRAEQLIDDFKGEGHNKNLHIAISVDMLDTGIDIPEVVNLVFAKPVKSFVKFWQMIGRGTRLCPNLFINPETGAREDKTQFLIFDHWGNFEYFGEDPREIEPSAKKSLLQQVFEKRLDLAELALKQQLTPAFELATDLLTKDVNALPDNTIAVREKWRQVKTVQQDGAIRRFEPVMVGTLRMEIAPLMQWREIEGHEEAHRFDLLIAKAQHAKLNNSADLENVKDTIVERVSQLPINLGQVAAKTPWIDKAKSATFWQNATVEELDEIRRELRGIMHCCNTPTIVRPKPLELDITDGDEKSERQIVKLEGLDLAAYRVRVDSVFKQLFSECPALQKIKAGEPVTPDELRDLSEKVTLRDPDLRVDDLLLHFPNKANRLDLAIRQVIGLDPNAINAHFNRFIRKYPDLSSHQIRFLELVKRHIAQYGELQLEKLYEQPFTQINSDGVDGVFQNDEQIDDLLDLLGKLNQGQPQEN